MADHLIRKKGESTWYCRIVVPKDVRPYFDNRTTLTKTTGTSDKLKAQTAKLPILAQWKADIAEARRQKAEAGDRWREELAEDAKRHHALADTVLLSAVKGTFVSKDRPAATPEVVADTLQKLEENLAAFYKDVLHLEESLDMPGLFDEVTNTLGNDDIPLTERLAKGSEIQQRVLAHAAKKQYLLSNTDLPEAYEIAATPGTYKPRSPITKSMLENWHQHLEHQVAAAKTRDMHRNRVQRLSNWLTSTGNELNFDSVHRFLEHVSPSRKTRQQYLWSCRDFWKWATKYNAQFRDRYANSPSPFEGHALPRAGKAAGESYEPFTRKQVEELHTKAKDKGDTALADLIVFAAFTGCRLEEIGRISIDSTVFVEGIPIAFKIQQAKTSAGIREVPIHPKLAPLYRKLLEAAPAHGGYLFEGGNNKYGNRLDSLSKRFGRLKKAAKYGPEHVFHSVRKCTTTELHQAGVSIEVLPALLGHENPSFTLNVYSSGPSFEQKKEAINKLQFVFK